MTDPVDPRDQTPTGDAGDAGDAGDPDPVDELVSAYLDGEATPEEVARIEADAALRARVEDLRAVATAVAAPVDPPPGEVRDAHVAAALAAADDHAVPAPPLAPPVDLAAERAGRDRHRRRLVALSVAAAVLVGVLAVPLLTRIGADGDTQTAAVEDTNAVEEGAPTTPAEPSAGGEGAEAGVADDGVADDAVSVVSLGSFADEDELLRAVDRARSEEVRADSAGETTQPLAAPEPSCPGPRPADAELVAVYDAELAGDPVTVYVYRRAGADTVLVLDAACDPLLQTDL
jgi:hypothetical protein